MLPANEWAFKEWAAVCAALSSGRQSVILRKGGIHEGRDGFRVEHREFWLYPTRFHQQPGELLDDARDFFEQGLSRQPPAGTVRFTDYAEVTDVVRITDETALPWLAGLHILSDATLAARFHYREPGLFALVVRMHRLAEPVDIPESPHFGGCRSWVDLPGALPTAGLTPVLDDAEFERQREKLFRALHPSQPC